MKQCCPWRERKVLPFHTPSTGLLQFPPPISTEVKDWGREKQRRPTPGATKSKQGKKQEESIIIIIICYSVYPMSKSLMTKAGILNQKGPYFLENSISRVVRYISKSTILKNFELVWYLKLSFSYLYLVVRKFK